MHAELTRSLCRQTSDRCAHCSCAIRENPVFRREGGKGEGKKRGKKRGGGEKRKTTLRAEWWQTRFYCIHPGGISFAADEKDCEQRNRRGKEKKRREESYCFATRFPPTCIVWPWKAARRRRADEGKEKEKRVRITLTARAGLS